MLTAAVKEKKSARERTVGGCIAGRRRYPFDDSEKRGRSKEMRKRGEKRHEEEEKIGADQTVVHPLIVAKER